MKKLLALLLILTLTSLCFLASCRGQNNPGDDDNPATPDDENSNDITDITDEESDGILNEDNIDPNGWTKVD